jgi:hypothetical protein
LPLRDQGVDNKVFLHICKNATLARLRVVPATNVLNSAGDAVTEKQRCSGGTSEFHSWLQRRISRRVGAAWGHSAISRGVGTREDICTTGPRAYTFPRPSRGTAVGSGSEGGGLHVPLRSRECRYRRKSKVGRDRRKGERAWGEFRLTIATRLHAIDT